MFKKHKLKEGDLHLNCRRNEKGELEVELMREVEIIASNLHLRDVIFVGFKNLGQIF